MEFLSLYKKYVQSEYDDFNDFYIRRFNSESSIHIPLKINEFDSFVFIHPLMLNKIATIYSLDKRVSELFSILPKVAHQQYIKKSLIDEIQYTNEIEGVVSTRQEINEILTSINSKRTIESRFEGIVNKYVMLLSNKSLPLSSAFDIRKIYDEMLLDEISHEDKANIPDGRIFRKSGVWVYDEKQEKIHAGVQPEEKIIEYIEEALKFLNNNEIDLIIRVAVFHYLFGHIHPFYDGNGRVDRFISSYVLSKNLTSIIGYRLSMTIKENLHAYYTAFKETNDKRNRGDITTFVMVFLDILIDALKKTEEYASRKNNEYFHYYSICKKQVFVNKKTLSIISLLLQVELFSKRALLISEITEISKLNQRTVSKTIDELVKLGMVKIINKGKRKLYTADTLAIGEKYN